MAEPQTDEQETVTLPLTMPAETWKLVQELAAQNHWPPEEALLTLLGYGIGYAQGQIYLQADKDEQRRFVARLNQMESQYAVMKFRAFTLQRANQRLAMRETGAQGTATLAEAVLGQVQNERNQWKAKAQALEREAAALRQQLAEAESPPSSWERIRAWFSCLPIASSADKWFSR